MLEQLFIYVLIFAAIYLLAGFFLFLIGIGDYIQTMNDFPNCNGEEESWIRTFFIIVFCGVGFLVYYFFKDILKNIFKSKED